MNNKTIKILAGLALIVSAVFVCGHTAKAETVYLGDRDVSVSFQGFPFELDNFYPGKETDTKTITVENGEDFDVDIAIAAESTSDSEKLAEVLNLSINGENATISELFKDNLSLTRLSPGEEEGYDLSIKFDEKAGNEYQNKTVSFDFIVEGRETGTENFETASFSGGGSSHILYSTDEKGTTSDKQDSKDQNLEDFNQEPGEEEKRQEVKGEKVENETRDEDVDEGGEEFDFGKGKGGVVDISDSSRGDFGTEVNKKQEEQRVKADKVEEESGQAGTEESSEPDTEETNEEATTTGSGNGLLVGWIKDMWWLWLLILAALLTWIFFAYKKRKRRRQDNPS